MTNLPVRDAPNKAIGKVIEWMLHDSPSGAEIDVTGPGGAKFTLNVKPRRYSVSDGSRAAGETEGLDPKDDSAARRETPNPLPADHAEVVKELRGRHEEAKAHAPHHMQAFPTVYSRAATLITSQAEEIERLRNQIEAEAEVCWSYRAEKEAAESSLASMTARCKELVTDPGLQSLADSLRPYADKTLGSLRIDISEVRKILSFYDAARALSQTKGTDD